jgi:hypothetical protein
MKTMTLEQEELEHKNTSDKYLPLLIELGKLFNKKVRELGTKHNVVPVSYTITPEWICRLLQMRDFEISWQRKTRCFNMEVLQKNHPKNPEDALVQDHYEWIQNKTFPNIGGIPVIEGSELGVEVIQLPRLKRRFQRHMGKCLESLQDCQSTSRIKRKSMSAMHFNDG